MARPWGLWRVLSGLNALLIAGGRRFYHPPIPNLKADRDIEYSWVAAHMPEGRGRALDFGYQGGWMALLAARKGWETVALDQQPVADPYVHPRLRFAQGDVLEVSLPAGHFDIVINCSTVEHVGLAGRYGAAQDRPDGDLEAMARLKELSKPGALMLLTVPVGRDRVYHPAHRVYGANRLPQLLNGWNVLEKEYWTKDERNRWIRADETRALGLETTGYFYGLGLFVLQRPTVSGENTEV
jgi:SAM-dependent methyltransferase